MELKFSKFPGEAPRTPPKGGGHPFPYPPPVSAAPTQKAQAPSSVSRLNGYLNRLNFFLATFLGSLITACDAACTRNVPINLNL